ncbi:MAG: ABC transporter permease [Saprospiraceae bacterium]|nr:ABC transporter permease [Saprospiraceae bacterium]
MNISKFLENRTYYSFRKSSIKHIIRIAIIATALCTSIVLIASSIFEGFQKQISEKVFGFWGHIHITDIRSNRSIEAIPIENVKSIKELCLNYKPESANKNYSPISNVEEFTIIPGILGINNEVDGLFLKGIKYGNNFQAISQFLKAGRTIQYNDSSFSREIILSEQTANKLKVEIESEIIVHFFLNNNHIQRKLHLVGIYRTGLEEYDRKFAIVDQKLLQQILHWNEDEVTGLEVFVKNIANVDKINEELYNEVLPESIYSETIRTKFPYIFEWLTLQDINKYFILGIIILVCIINISTIILILIMSRTPMIGLLSALGMNTWNQRKIFIRYGIRIVLGGMLIGNMIGIGLCILQKQFKFIKLNEADYYLDHAPISLNPNLFILVNLVFFIVIGLSLLLPSYYVSRIDPVKAIKFR